MGALPLAVSLALSLACAVADAATGQDAAPSFEARMQRGRAQMQAGDRYAALREFSLALQARPRDPDTRRAVADVLVELGAPQAASRTLQAETDIGLRSRMAAEAVRWGGQVEPEGPDRFGDIDAAIATLERLLEQARSLPVSDPGLERRLQGDRIVALRDRTRWADAVAAAEMLRQAGPLPSYVRLAEADALLALQRPEEAIAAYGEVLAADPGNRAALSGLFYAQSDAGDFDAAFATVDAYGAGLAPGRTVGLSPRPQPDPAWLDAQMLWSQSRRFADLPDQAWERLHPLALQAPAAAWLRLEQGEIASARGWPRLAHEEIRIAHGLAPGDAGIQLALAQVEFSRRQWMASERRARGLEAIVPGNGGLQRLLGEIEAHRDALLQLSLAPRRADGGGPNAQGNGMSGALRAYTSPLSERWRLLAAAEREVDQPEEEQLARNRYGAGIQGRWPDVTVELVAWSNHGLLSHGGGDLGVQWQPDDRWSFDAGLQAFSSATPLRALQAGVRADKAAAGMTYAWSHQAVLSLSVATLDFTDGNRRHEGTLDFAGVVVDRPGLELVLRPAVYASRNSRRDAPYFNPASDTSLTLSADLRHRLWHRYERSLQQRLQVTAGDYRQSGYGHDLVGRIEYSQAYRHDPRVEWNYGVACGWQAYDGDIERSLSLFVRLDRRFR